MTILTPSLALWRVGLPLFQMSISVCSWMITMDNQYGALAGKWKHKIFSMGCWWGQLGFLGTDQGRKNPNSPVPWPAHFLLLFLHPSCPPTSSGLLTFTHVWFMEDLHPITPRVWMRHATNHYFPTLSLYHNPIQVCKTLQHEGVQFDIRTQLRFWLINQCHG